MCTPSFLFCICGDPFNYTTWKVDGATPISLGLSWPLTKNPPIFRSGDRHRSCHHSCFSWVKIPFLGNHDISITVKLQRLGWCAISKTGGSRKRNHQTVETHVYHGKSAKSTVTTTSNIILYAAKKTCIPISIHESIPYNSSLYYIMYKSYTVNVFGSKVWMNRWNLNINSQSNWSCTSWRCSSCARPQGGGLVVVEASGSFVEFSSLLQNWFHPEHLHICHFQFQNASLTPHLKKW